MQSLKTANVIAVSAALAATFITLMIVCYLGATETARTADEYATKVGVACVQSGGEWTHRDASCRR